MELPMFFCNEWGYKKKKTKQKMVIYYQYHLNENISYHLQKGRKDSEEGTALSWNKSSSRNNPPLPVFFLFAPSLSPLPSLFSSHLSEV